MKTHKNIQALLIAYEEEKALMYNYVWDDEDDRQFIHDFAKENKLTKLKKH
jgi:hypothetical protein